MPSPFQRASISDTYGMAGSGSAGHSHCGDRLACSRQTQTSRTIMRSKIRFVGVGDVAIASQELRMLGADRFGPVADVGIRDQVPIGDCARPGRSKDTGILYYECDLQSFLRCILVNGALSITASAGWARPKFPLGLGSDVSVDQTISLHDMQCLRMRCAESING